VYQKIANDLILNFEAKHIKTIYWTGKGKDYRWIAQNVFQDKVLEGTVRNYMWEVGKVFKKYVIYNESKKIFMLLVRRVLEIMIEGDPDNIDNAWPPPPIPWENLFLKNLDQLPQFIQIEKMTNPQFVKWLETLGKQTRQTDTEK